MESIYKNIVAVVSLGLLVGFAIGCTPDKFKSRLKEINAVKDINNIEALVVENEPDAEQANGIEKDNKIPDNSPTEKEEVVENSGTSVDMKELEQLSTHSIYLLQLPEDFDFSTDEVGKDDFSQKFYLVGETTMLQEGFKFKDLLEPKDRLTLLGKKPYFLVSYDFDLSIYEAGAKVYFHKSLEKSRGKAAEDDFTASQLGCLLIRGNKTESHETVDDVHAEIKGENSSKLPNIFIGHPLNLLEDEGLIVMKIPSIDITLRCKGVDTLSEIFSNLPTGFLVGIAFSESDSVEATEGADSSVIEEEERKEDLEVFQSVKSVVAEDNIEMGIKALNFYLDNYPEGQFVAEAKKLLEAFQSVKSVVAEGNIEKGIDALELYLDNYPEGQFVTKAEELKRDLEGFQWVETVVAEGNIEKSIEALELYLEIYPEGEFVAEAKKLLEAAKNNPPGQPKVDPPKEDPPKEDPSPQPDQIMGPPSPEAGGPPIGPGDKKNPSGQPSHEIMGPPNPNPIIKAGGPPTRGYPKKQTQIESSSRGGPPIGPGDKIDEDKPKSGKVEEGNNILIDPSTNKPRRIPHVVDGGTPKSSSRGGASSPIKAGGPPTRGYAKKQTQIGSGNNILIDPTTNKPRRIPHVVDGGTPESKVNESLSSFFSRLVTSIDDLTKEYGEGWQPEGVKKYKALLEQVKSAVTNDGIAKAIEVVDSYLSSYPSRQFIFRVNKLRKELQALE